MLVVINVGAVDRSIQRRRIHHGLQVTVVADQLSHYLRNPLIRHTARIYTR